MPSARPAVFEFFGRRLFSLLSARPRPDERPQILRQQVVGDEVRLQQQTFPAGVHPDCTAHVAAAHPARRVGQPPLCASMTDVAGKAVRRARRQGDTGNREQICGVVAADVEFQIESLELHRIGHGSGRLHLQVAERQVDIDRIRLLGTLELLPWAAEEADREGSALALRLALDLYLVLSVAGHLDFPVGAIVRGLKSNDVEGGVSVYLCIVVDEVALVQVESLNDRYFLPLRRGRAARGRLRTGRELPVRLTLGVLLEQHARTGNADLRNQNAPVEQLPDIDREIEVSDLHYVRLLGLGPVGVGDRDVGQPNSGHPPEIEAGVAVDLHLSAECGAGGSRRQLLPIVRVVDREDGCDRCDGQADDDSYNGEDGGGRHRDYPCHDHFAPRSSRREMTPPSTCSACNHRRSIDNA